MSEHDPNHPATLAQITAANPANSTWLSANAGSGKTRVLTDRVARLLLERVPPERILCLTYTKAAASEMQNRLFKRLGQWAMMESGALRKTLRELGATDHLDDDDLRRARTLFAAAIEAPGGLKIQTIHSFCSSILRRFPLEAGVSPQFTELEERASALLREEVIEDMAQGDQAHLIVTLARAAGIHDLTALSGEIVGLRSQVAKDITDEAVFDLFGLPRGMTAEDINRNVFLGSEQDILDALMPLLASSGPKDQTALAKLRTINRLDHHALPTLESTFLTQKGEVPKKPIPAKDIRTGPFAPFVDQLDQLIHRLAEARVQRLVLEQAQIAVALNRFAAAFLEAFDRRKQERGGLDFDDLILKTRDLLNDPQVAQWVLYRLDGGIDHILVDEAQDTSPEQWDVIERLLEDFVSGESARANTPRTIFVVGDKKQSIYSFQGADPREFDRMRDKVGAKLKQTDTSLEPAELHYSFRSAGAILELVDQVFAGKAEAGFPSAGSHIPFHDDMPGRVDIWPVIEAAKEKTGRGDTGEFIDTTDKVSEEHHTVQLAQRIATEIHRMIKLPEMIDEKGGTRAVRPGDILILVQKRKLLFTEIIRACKNLGLPIAGADRLKVAQELAVRDIRALLSFLATPEDDYALAVTLKSPLFGWSEKQLFDLAQPRKGFLWEHMRAQTGLYDHEIAVLRDLRDTADFLRPYELIERVLTRHEGRKRLVGRLGAEAEDGLDALLSQALSYERSQTPSLTGFLTWMESDDLTVKRQMSSDMDEIRVMTVHGAKGLEAPIVILPDTAIKGGGMRDELIGLDQIISKNAARAAAPEPVQQKQDERAQREAEEDMRLLYVAMTRAEKWLIVAASGKTGEGEEKCWYDLVRNAALQQHSVDHAHSFGTGLRIEPKPWGSAPTIKADQTTPKRHAPLPDHFNHPALMPDVPTGPLSPSTDLKGAKALPSEAALDEDAAMERGTQIHMLLDHFANTPRADWDQAAAMLLPGVPDRSALVAEAAAVLDTPDLAFLFDDTTLGEVGVTSPIPALGGRPIYGVIDRLVPGDPLWIVDFKTNVAIPDHPNACPEGILRQMGAYAAAIAQIYPKAHVRTAIVWTRNARLMELPSDLTTAALARAATQLGIDDTRPQT